MPVQCTSLRPHLKATSGEAITRAVFTRYTNAIMYAAHHVVQTSHASWTQLTQSQTIARAEMKLMTSYDEWHDLYCA